ncbi:McrB family protein [Clostridium sp. HCS.1]|uniref:McrB family protein n=1 Tax=Clostridium sp. HCS.1 TaxID=3238594 RepID=UPI0025CBFB2D|nr:AAA family ATPase [uncultured Clostridium sp.]
MVNFIKILDFLREYNNKPYQKIEKIDDSRKREEMIKIKNSASEMINEWKKIYTKFTEKGYIYNTKSASQWLDGSNKKVRDYLWIEFKRADKGNLTSSISVFAEIINSEPQIRISIEIRGSESDKNEKRRHNRYLDYINMNDDTLEFFGSENNYVDYKILSIDEVNDFIIKVKEDKYKKLQVGKSISYNEIKTNGNEYTLKILEDSFNKLEAYYDKCVEDIDGFDKKEISEEKESILLEIKGQITLQDKIERIENYIKSKSFIYNKEELSNFYLSLKTKPFVILAGISGSGKSKLVKLFAEAIGCKDNYKLISVKPDWNDSTELLGYKNIKDDFIAGELLKTIKTASKPINKNKSYFVCLDEMNLARVEYYLSEYLSIIESRERNENGEIVTNPIISDNYLPDGNEYKGLGIPENLYIIGTVNMDDTTFSFSRKVLDRANTIEFLDVNLETLDFDNEQVINIDVDNKFLETTFLNIREAVNYDKDFVKRINDKIIEINNILKQYSRHFGYRVRDEIVFYMLENNIVQLLDENVAFDYQIMQKILPTIIGSDECIKEILIKLFNYCLDGTEIDPDGDYVNEAKENIKNAKYKMSAQKIYMMLRGYRDGYTSFWI